MRPEQSEKPPAALQPVSGAHKRSGPHPRSGRLHAGSAASNCSRPQVDWLDGVLITHEHADHTHGIDDLRPLFVHKRRRVQVYLDEPTARVMHARFGYCFATPPGSEYPPILTERRLVPGQAVTIDGQGGAIEFMTVLQEHGDIPSLGFRFGNVAYSADIKGLPDASLAALAGLDVWIVDALRPSPHPSHFNLDEALAWIAPREAQAGDPDQSAQRHGLRRACAPACRPGSNRPMTGCVSRADLFRQKSSPIALESYGQFRFEPAFSTIHLFRK